jgi:hypothetical protein
MPTSKLPAYKAKGYRFLFYSSDEGEPPHLHVKAQGKHAKFWLIPETKLAQNKHGSYRDHELNEIYDIIEENTDFFLEEWHEHFGSAT